MSDQLAGAMPPMEAPVRGVLGSFGQILSWSSCKRFGSSLADQAFSVGGMFLANIALARAQTKEEYGMFALSYSVYVFLVGLHNAAILEPYTIHGAGRYHPYFSQYSARMFRSNGLLGLFLTAVILGTWAWLHARGHALASRSFLGLGLTLAVLLTALFVRRTLYLRRRADLAAKFSGIFFGTLCLLLVLCAQLKYLNGLSVFLVVAAAWIVAGLWMRRELPATEDAQTGSELKPDHWSEHWKYARWVLATAFVFQLTNQGYYWLLASFLSLKEVGELRAMYILVGPVDQIIAALTMIALPMMVLRYASNQHPQLVAMWKTFGLITLVVTSSYSLAIWLLARPLMHMIYAAKFDDISMLLAVLAPLPAVMGIGNSLNVALKSVERPDIVLGAYLSSGAATFLIGIPLVERYGLRGAVYGMLASAGFYSLTMAIGLMFTANSRLKHVRLFSASSY